MSFSRMEVPVATELAARSLCRLSGLAEDSQVGGLSRWRMFVPQVLAVLRAIREPTIEMTMACEDERGCVGSHSAIFRMMVDAAIDDGVSLGSKHQPPRIAA